ncbi:DUF2219 family protein [Aquicoccus sp. SCR17]|nr:DUF2219 family protein [Carideicomes alvinocaridis]
MARRLRGPGAPMRLIAGALCAALALGGPAVAQERTKLGYGRIINNDVFFDLRDRWQTTSFQSSRVYGPAWTGTLPETPGALLEFRLTGAMVAPASLADPDPADRPWAGYLGAGLHTHYQARGYEVSLGADLIVTGPQLGLMDLQRGVHDVINAPQPSAAVEAGQIGNGTYPTLVVEMGRPLPLGEGVTLRPFVQGRWGLETLARAGFDMTIGPAGTGELLVRDAVTGQRYPSIKRDQPRPSFIMGADLAHVGHSVLLPESRGLELTDARLRVRSGVHWQSRWGRFFYGLTWLGREFEAQPEGQIVGSLRLDLDF